MVSRFGNTMRATISALRTSRHSPDRPVRKNRSACGGFSSKPVSSSVALSFSISAIARLCWREFFVWKKCTLAPGFIPEAYTVGTRKKSESSNPNTRW